MAGRQVRVGDAAVLLDARPDPAAPGRWIVVVGDATHVVDARLTPDGSLLVDREGASPVRAVVSRAGTDRWVSVGGVTWRLPEAAHDGDGAHDEGEGLEAPMPGTVLAVEVAPGDAVEKGQVLVVVEAMKMEHAIRAPHAGVIASVTADVGAMVSPGTPLVVFEVESDAP